MQVEAITPLWWQLGAPYAEIELRENITEPLPVTVAKDSSAAPCVRITSTLADSIGIALLTKINAINVDIVGWENASRRA